MLDRLRADFDGLRIFFNDPVLPPNGHAGHNWRDDLQLTLHIQDDVRLVRDTGNLYLTNIHRVFLGNVREPSLDDDNLRDYFLTDAFGNKPAGRTTDSKTDLGELIREIEELAAFLEEASDVQAFARNYPAVGFRLDYVKTNGDLANYTPDFIIRTNDQTIRLAETKGRAELDLPQKMARLRDWCTDATAAEAGEGGLPGRRYDFVFVDQTGFEKHQPKTLAALAAGFTEYRSPSKATQPGQRDCQA